MEIKKIDDYSLSYITYNEAGSMPYLPNKCYDNAFNVFVNAVEQGRGTARVMSAVYGVVVSGEPFKGGVAVFHAWNDFMNTIIDTTMIADGKRIEEVSEYGYVEWRKYNAQALVRALEAKVDDYPAERMKRDTEFIKAIKSMGYEVIG